MQNSITNLFLYYILRLSVHKRYQIPMGQSKMDNPEKKRQHRGHNPKTNKAKTQHNMSLDTTILKQTQQT